MYIVSMDLANSREQASLEMMLRWTDASQRTCQTAMEVTPISMSDAPYRELSYQTCLLKRYSLSHHSILHPPLCDDTVTRIGIPRSEHTMSICQLVSALSDLELYYISCT